MKAATISSLLVAGALFLSAPSTEAYVWNATGCSFLPGGVCRWISGARMHRDRCSMPDGWDSDWSYWNAGDQWDNVAAVMDWNWWYNDGCVITAQNGRSETATVNPSQIGGLNGLATCWKSSWGWSECDIKLSNQLNYWNEDESFWNWSNTNQGRVVVLHEFGHAMGLGHDNNQFAVMRSNTPYPLNGGPGFHGEPFPDDANGVRALYSTYQSPGANLFATAQKYVNGVVQATESGSCVTINRCRGQTLSVTVSIGSNGWLAPLSHGVRIFLNNSPSGYTGGWNMFVGTANNPPGTYSTQTLNLTVPSVPNGTYWILWQVDTQNGTAESNEQDNAVHACKTVNVTC